MRTTNNNKRQGHAGETAMLAFQLIGFALMALFLGALISSKQPT